MIAVALIEIRIVLNDVLTEVGRITHYASRKKNTEGNTYEMTSTTKSDETMLTQFWSHACNSVVIELKKFITNDNTTPAVFAINLTPNISFNPAFVDSVTEDIKQYIIQYVVSEWMNLTGNADSAASYAAKALSLIADAKRKMYHKRTPVRPLENE